MGDDLGRVVGGADGVGDDQAGHDVGEAAQGAEREGVEGAAADGAGLGADLRGDAAAARAAELVDLLWQTDELRLERPEVLDEALAHFADLGLIDPPFLIQGVIGILGGIGADVRNLAHMVSIADGLFGDQYMLSAFAAGRHQMDFCTQSVLLGGHARVGLEDSLYIGRGELATSNAQQVARVRTIIEALGREIASPAEAREMLGLKGGDAVAF